jgi:hypothetical protein
MRLSFYLTQHDDWSTRWSYEVPAMRRVLVVDDNADLLEVICFLLQSDDFSVEGVRGSAAALVSAIKEPPSNLPDRYGHPGHGRVRAGSGPAPFFAASFFDRYERF